MMKIGFALITNNDSLWVQVLKSKYKWRERVPISIKRPGCSRLWLGICSVWEDLKECINWDIRDGRDTDFWFDHWLGKDNRLAFSCIMSNMPRPIRVVDMVSENGMWDWDKLELMLPKESLEQIAAIPPPRAEFGEDKPTWRWEDKRHFSTRTAYDFLTNDLGICESNVWRKIWRLGVPQRIRTFIWLAFHERLMTNVEGVRRHLSALELCGICGGDREDVAHVLRDCVVAKGLWTKQWLFKNLFDATFMAIDADWSIRFAIFCWLLWKRRCCLLLDSETGVLGDIYMHGNRMVEECSRVKCDMQRDRGGRVLVSNWAPPQVGWVKLNVDAAVATVDHTVGIEGVVRDENGVWLFGYARFVGRCDVLLAEFWAIHDGLLHVWSMGYRRVELESDCLEAVRVINNESDMMGGSVLVESIKRLLGQDWRVEVRYISRENNRIADLLAKRGRNMQLVPLRFVTPPVELERLVEEEARALQQSAASSQLVDIVAPFDPGGTEDGLI
ncbi:hypothetical protein GQ457_15G009690 [Hibiscus cannabinus]